MDTTTHTVTLRNGKQVLWDEFATWSSARQNSNLNLKEAFNERKHKPWNLSMSLLSSSLTKASFRNATRNFGASNGSSKVVMTPKGKFPSRISAAKHYGVSSREMYDWIRSDLKPDFYYLESFNSPPRKLGSKSVSTPAGNFESLAAAARNYQVSAATINNWIKNRPDSGFRYDTYSPNNGAIPGAKPLMTSAGKFMSLKLASNHFGVQVATIRKWITKGQPDFYFL